MKKQIKTNHEVVIGAAQNMERVIDNSVALVVTSPPYPMIEMWDDIMSNQNYQISEAFKNNEGATAFELMHLELDKIWAEVDRVLIPGGFACINIGDATRTINKEFQLYPNHSRIISAFQKIGMSNLPNIIWRKQTNAPNKFMGSGMLPAGAYVTLEHEWILIFRKGNKRVFKTSEEKLKRQQSSFFWEERNIWFSDLWDLKGTKQNLVNSKTRERSAAYPFEIPYRLINMYSLKGDTVLDPFIGTGTTSLAAMSCERNSIGYDIDSNFMEIIKARFDTYPIDYYNNLIDNRLDNHKNFILERQADPKKSDIKYYNENIKMPVMTRQELNISFNYIENIKFKKENKIEVSYNQIKKHSDFIPSPSKKGEPNLFG